jgi:hypothetical protein
MSMAGYSPLSSWLVTGLNFSISVQGDEAEFGPVPSNSARPKSLSLLITISLPPLSAATPSILSLDPGFAAECGCDY